jgi:hypothetical protein
VILSKFVSQNRLPDDTLFRTFAGIEQFRRDLPARQPPTLDVVRIWHLLPFPVSAFGYQKLFSSLARSGPKASTLGKPGKAGVPMGGRQARRPLGGLVLGVFGQPPCAFPNEVLPGRLMVRELIRREGPKPGRGCST